MRSIRTLVIVVMLATWAILAVVALQHPEDWRKFALGAGVAGVAGLLAALAGGGGRSRARAGQCSDGSEVLLVSGAASAGHSGDHASPDSGGHSDAGGGSGGGDSGGGGDGGGGGGGGD